jgi:SAM-dependent methyltransferase
VASTSAGQPDGRSNAEREAIDAMRPHVHGMWAAAAPSWGERAAYVDERAAPIAERLLALSAPQPGERVLELACGPGGLGLAAAGLVGPGGEVVLSDVAQEMAAIAAARAQERGLTNVTTRVLDLERIDEPDRSYDVVLCRDGLMFALVPARAAGELARVLRPGGRVALAVWGPRERNPWLGVVLDAVSDQVGAPVPPPGVPGPFALQDAGALAGLLSGAGLADVTVGEVPVPFEAASAEEWWALTTALAGPLATLLTSLPADAAQALRARALEVIGSYRTPAGTLQIPGVSLVAAGRRPG